MSPAAAATFTIKNQGFGLGPKAPCPDEVDFKVTNPIAEQPPGGLIDPAAKSASITINHPPTRRLADGSCVVTKASTSYRPSFPYKSGLDPLEYKGQVDVTLQTISNDGSSLYIADGTRQYTLVRPPSTTKSLAWSNDIHPAAAPSGSSPPGPEGVSVMNNGNVLVTDTPNSALQTFTPGSKTTPSAGTAPFATSFTGNGYFGPRQSAQVTSNEIDVSDSFDGQIKRVKMSDGSDLGHLTPGPYSVTLPRGIATSDDGSLVAITDVGDGNPGNGKIFLFGSSPSWPTFKRAITGLHQPEGVAFDRQGHLWVANTADKTILEYDPTTGLPAPPGNPAGALTAAGEAPLGGPTGIAIDPSNNVWVADWSTHRVIEFNPSVSKVLRVITTASGPSDPITAPVTLAFDNNPSSIHHGDLYITDTTHDRVVHFALTAVSARTPSLGRLAGAAAKTVSKKKPLTLRGKMQHVLIPKGTPLPKLSYGPQGTIRVKGVQLGGKLALKLKGPKKAVKRAPAALQGLLTSKFRTNLTGLLIPNLFDHRPLLASGLLATRAASGEIGCARITPAGRGPLELRTERVKLIGGTGQLANLKLTASMSELPTKPFASPKFLSVKVGTSKTSHGIGPCASLASKL